MLIWMFSFTSLVREFLILLASSFVAFLTLERSFKLIFYLVNLSLVCEFLILLASSFVAFLTLERSFKLIFIISIFCDVFDLSVFV
jgi:hypothetical protein